MNVWHHYVVEGLQLFLVERLVLHEEIMESRVGIELIELVQKFVHIHMIPSVIQTAIACFFIELYDFAIMSRQSHAQTHWCVVCNAILLPKSLIVIDNGMLLE